MLFPAVEIKFGKNIKAVTEPTLLCGQFYTCFLHLFETKIKVLDFICARVRWHNDDIYILWATMHFHYKGQVIPDYASNSMRNLFETQTKRFHANALKPKFKDSNWTFTNWSSAIWMQLYA